MVSANLGATDNCSFLRNTMQSIASAYLPVNLDTRKAITTPEYAWEPPKLSVQQPIKERSSYSHHFADRGAARQGVVPCIDAGGVATLSFSFLANGNLSLD